MKLLILVLTMSAPISKFLLCSYLLCMHFFFHFGQIPKEDSLGFRHREALLILPGFGSKVFGTKKISTFFKDCGYDLYVPKYISRKSLDASVENLNRYMKKHHLSDYESVHVFSYIFGTWTINYWIKKYGKGNIKTIVYDRSPLQERAPAVLMKDSPLLAKVLFGNVMKDFCNAPYIPVDDSTISKGIFIENYATKLINKHKETAMSMGNVNFGISSLNQKVDDYCFLPLNHDEMYKELSVFGPEVIHFIKNHTFSQEIKSKKYQVNPFIKFRKH